MTNGRDTSGWAASFTLFAAIMMLMVGAWQALAGLVAIFENEFYLSTRNYLYEFDATTWGWIHLVIGLVVAFAGWGLLSGRTWARLVGITLAALSATANFLFLPWYPLWSLLIIAVASSSSGRWPPTAASTRRGGTPRPSTGCTASARPGPQEGGRVTNWPCPARSPQMV